VNFAHFTAGLAKKALLQGKRSANDARLLGDVVKRYVDLDALAAVEAK
jgi:hypothetical protein